MENMDVAGIFGLTKSLLAIPAGQPAPAAGWRHTKHVNASGETIVTATTRKEAGERLDGINLQRGDLTQKYRVFLQDNLEPAGLRQGDLIDSIDGETIASVEQTIAILTASGGTVAITVQRPNESIRPTLAPPPDVTLSLSAVELLVATEDLQYLLRSVPACLLRKGAELTHALRRYETIWMPLAAMAVAEKDLSMLVPPPDVSWVWLCHQLAPAHYVEDCAALFRTVPSRLPSAWQRHHWPAGIGLDRARAGLAYTDAEYAVSAQRWAAFCESHGLGHEPFWVPWAPRGPDARKEAPPSADTTAFVSKFGYDIAAAVERQNVFNYQVSLPHYLETPFLQRAVARYLCFLELRRRNPGKFLVPTYDIDVVWHAHQLQPSYVADTTALFGQLLDHDDSVNDRTPGAKLATSADATRQMWHEAFEHGWAIDGGMYRGQPPPPMPPTAPEIARALEGLVEIEEAASRCLCCAAEPASCAWNYLLQPGSFAPVPEVLLMPGGEMVTLTPVDGSAAVKAATSLKAATHALVCERVVKGNLQRDVAPFTLKVVHAEGASLDASCVQVMDAAGNELAAARLVDSATVPKRDPRGRLAIPLVFGQNQWVRPLARIDPETRKVYTQDGRTSDVGLLVTSSGSDTVLALCSWQNFHPGAPGIPGRRPVGNTPGLKGTRGVKRAHGEFVVQLHELEPSLQGQPEMLATVTTVGSGDNAYGEIRILRPGHTLVTANLLTGAITITDLSGDAETMLGSADAAIARVSEHAALIALVLGTCIALQICQKVALRMTPLATNYESNYDSTPLNEKNSNLLIAAAGVPTLSLSFWMACGAQDLSEDDRNKGTVAGGCGGCGGAGCGGGGGGGGGGGCGGCGGCGGGGGGGGGGDGGGCVGGGGGCGA